MAEITEKILSKKSKIQATLLDINKEVSGILSFLNKLKIHSAEIVENLNSATSPALYLKKFVDVNSCLLKYLSLLTEVSCKFEVLEISENGLGSLTIVSDSITNSDKQTENNEKLNSVAAWPNTITKSKKVIETASSEKSSTESSSSVNVKSPNVNKNSKKNSPKLKNQKPENGTQPKKTKARKNLLPETNKLVTSSSSSCSSSTGSHTKSQIDPIEEFCVWETETSETSSGEIGPSGKAGATGFQCKSASISPSSKVQIQQDKSSSLDVPVAEVVPTKVSESDLKAGINDICLKDVNIGKVKTLESNKVNEMKSEKDEITPVIIPKKEGDEYEITIEHIQSPSEFYVYIDGIQVDSVVELLGKLKTIVHNKNNGWNSKNRKNKLSLSKQLGSYVLYYSRCDEIWCRAKVINWGLNYEDNFIKIFLLDYGEYKSVTIEDIESMPEYLKKYPVLLHRCHLYGVLPLDVDKDSEALSWGKGPTEKMKSLTEVAKKLKIKIAPKDGFHSSSSLPVTLWIPGQNTKCVNELLVNYKCAIYQPYCDMRVLMSDTQVEDNAQVEVEVQGITKDAKVEEKDLLSGWNPMKEDFESYENTYDLQIDDPAMYIYGYVGKDYDRICMNYAKTGYCYKGQSCRKEHKKLDYLGFTTDQEEVYNNAFSELNVPAVNTTAAVQVTCLLDVNIFCCILQNHTWSSEEETLQSLLKFMNSSENVQSMKKLLIPPSAGQIVIAQYSQDQSWYRAKILDSQPENDTYTILFVDYGNKEDVSLRRIRAIEARYLHLPFQAVKCFIFGIEWNPEVPKRDVINYLDKKITDQHLSIEIVAKFPGECISVLAHVFDQNGENIGKDLLAKNYAIPKKEMIVSGDSVSMPG